MADEGSATDRCLDVAEILTTALALFREHSPPEGDEEAPDAARASVCLLAFARHLPACAGESQRAIATAEDSWSSLPPL